MSSSRRDSTLLRKQLARWSYHRYHTMYMLSVIRKGGGFVVCDASHSNQYTQKMNKPLPF